MKISFDIFVVARLNLLIVFFDNTLILYRNIHLRNKLIDLEYTKYLETWASFQRNERTNNFSVIIHECYLVALIQLNRSRIQMY